MVLAVNNTLNKYMFYLSYLHCFIQNISFILVMAALCMVG